MDGAARRPYQLRLSSSLRELARPSDIGLDLFLEHVDAREFLLGAQILKETNLGFLSIDIAIEVEEMDLQCSLRLSRATVGRTPRLMTP